MKTALLEQKTARYLQGEALPAEERQIQTWLSCTNSRKDATDEERAMIENEILHEIRLYTGYEILHPKAEPWWRKITAFF